MAALLRHSRRAAAHLRSVGVDALVRPTNAACCCSSSSSSSYISSNSFHLDSSSSRVEKVNSSSSSNHADSSSNHADSSSALLGSSMQHLKSSSGHVGSSSLLGGGSSIRVQSLSSSTSLRKKGGDAAGSGGKPAAASGVDRRDKRDMLMEACLKSADVAEPKLGESELAADRERAKEYSRRMMALHRKRQASESARLKLKLAAIQALPPGRLREAAMEPDYTPFPPGMVAPSLTPPVPSQTEERSHERAKPVRKLR